MAMRPPGGSNTYVPSYDASGPVIEFCRSSESFRINQYIKSIPVKKDQGYYLRIDPLEPIRIVTPNDYLWEDGADAPIGNEHKSEFEYASYRTNRMAFPFAIGSKAVAQADWQILAAHARKVAAKSMLVRTIISTQLLTAPVNWNGNTAVATGDWYASTVAQSYIQETINNALIGIELATGGIGVDEDAMVLVINPNRARKMAKSPELKDYVKGSPDAYASITDGKNQNRRYGLPPYLYGVKIVVENAVRTATRKGVPANRNYVWPDDKAVLMARPEGLMAPDAASGTDFTTLAFRFYEEMTVESKSDPDNRREHGRVVEDYAVTLQAPETGCCITF